MQAQWLLPGRDCCCVNVGHALAGPACGRACVLLARQSGRFACSAAERKAGRVCRLVGCLQQTSKPVQQAGTHQTGWPCLPAQLQQLTRSPARSLLSQASSDLSMTPTLKLLTGWVCYLLRCDVLCRSSQHATATQTSTTAACSGCCCGSTTRALLMRCCMTCHLAGGTTTGRAVSTAGEEGP